MQTTRLNHEKVSQYILKWDIDDFETVMFLRKHIWKNLLISEIDDIKLTYTVRYGEHWKDYVFPATLFDGEDLENNYDTDENKQNIIQRVFFHIKQKEKDLKYIWIFVCLLIIIWKQYIPSNASLLTTWPTTQKIQTKEKSQVDILTEKLNKNNIEIALKKEERKKTLDTLKNIESQIKEKENLNSMIIENINLITK